MPSSKRLPTLVLITLTLATIALSGCIQIQVIDRTPVAPQPTTDTAKRQIAEHDLAVLAVDFDPPLEYEKIAERQNRGEGITLLVAVENTGINTEQNINVQIKLSKDQDKTAFLEQQGTISMISPGEIKIIHFKDTDIPFSYEYHLNVQVLPVAGETRLLDNQKSYDLIITQP
jgi:hypothetical protein